MLAPGSAIDEMQMVLVAPVMVFELVFGLWLTIRSIDPPVAAHPSDWDALWRVHTGARGPRGEGIARF